MKIRIADRLLVDVAGLLLVAFAAGIVAHAGFGVEVAGLIQGRLDAWTQQNKLMTAIGVWAAAAIIALLGLYCVGVLFRHQKRSRRGFVMQQTEGGELSISIRAIEGLVQKCVDRQEEINVVSTSLETARDGLIIKLRIGLAGGVNIPLAVAALQKQIKQYVTSCSGVDVKEVKVQVETSASKGKKSPYTVETLPEKAAPLPTVQDTTPEITAASVEAQENEEKKRPLHQRIFGSVEEPVNLPVPPAPETAAEPESQIEPAAEEPAPASEPVQEACAEEPPAEEAAAEENVTVPAAEEEKHEDAE